MLEQTSKTVANPKIAVYGLWHLGCVTAASLAGEGFEVYGLDNDRAVIQNLQAGQPPIFEPGLAELVQQSVQAGHLKFSSDPAEALAQADLIWVAFDTPVDEEDRADLDFVRQRLAEIFPYIRPGAVVLISSQVPVGFTAEIAANWQVADPQRGLTLAYSPENLRLGQGLKTFRAEDRIVVGLDKSENYTASHELLEKVLSRFCPRLEWMSVKSAEMTKHSLNAFLAVSVAMINEIARICEETGADAKEVERGLKSEGRIGPKAYLGPGGPFAGGTLARDLRFLTALGRQYNQATPILSGALESNEIHKGWVQEAAGGVLAGLDAPRVAILGLTYKPDTDTLRRSEAVSLGLWLVGQGAKVVFHDPVTVQLPPELVGQFSLTNQLETALAGADLAVVATGWPIYRETITPALLIEKMNRPVVIDQNRFLVAALGQAEEITYLAVGKPDKK